MTLAHPLHEEGPFETGCFTHAGNELALTCDNTRALWAEKNRLFAQASDALRPPCDDEAVYEYCYKASRLLYLITVEQRRQDSGDAFLFDVVETYPDFVHWLIRDFGRWLGEGHKVICPYCKTETEVRDGRYRTHPGPNGDCAYSSRWSDNPDHYARTPDRMA